jgi:hypothetical protein
MQVIIIQGMDREEMNNLIIQPCHQGNSEQK